MTISSTPRKAGPFDGNGVTTSFPFTFKVFAKSDLEVVRTMPSGVEETLVLDSDYAVTLNGDQDANPGGTITYPVSGTPLPTGWRLTAIGTLDNIQPTDITNGGGFYPQVIENALDRVTMLIQQLEEELGRTIRIAVSDDVTDGLDLPATSARADKVLGFDSEGSFRLYDTSVSVTATLYRKFTPTAGQTEFTLPQAYTPGVNALYVFRNGSKLVSGVDFTETSTTSFDLLVGAAGTDVIEALAGVPQADLPSTDAGLVRYTPEGAGAVGRTAQSKMREIVSVKDFGAVGDGVSDDTAAVQAAHAASKQVHYPPGRYKVTMANNAALVTFTSQTGIRITGDGAVIYDPHIYTGDPVAPVFDFVGCSDAVVQLNYEGASLSSPTTQLGYLGGTFVRWRNGSDNIRVDAEITNARYGVLSGNYSDTAQGGNKNIKANLRTRMCGYPAALYDVEGVDIEIDADGIHRAAYLAGVQNGRVLASWKDQYIAPMAVICTDALISGPALKGCKNLEIQSYDKGSTVFQDASTCCGLSPSRSAYPVTHSNLRFNFSVTSTDTISTKVGGFTIGGGSGPLPSGDPYNWEQTTVLENITVSGVVNRTGQTLDSNTAGDVYVNTNDSGTHYATVRNISFENITIVPSSGTTRDCWLIAPGLEDVVSFRNVVSSGAVDFQLAYRSTARAVFENCVLPGLIQAGTVGAIQLNNTSIASMPAALTANGNPINASTQNGAGMTLRYKETTLTLSGASNTWTNAIPLGAVVMGCVSRIMTDITGAAGYLLGIGTDTTLWANTGNLTAGLSTTPTNYGAAALSPQVYQATTGIVVTAKTSDFTGGTLKVCLYYFDTTGPTS